MDHGKVIALDTPRGLRRLLPAERGLEVVVEAREDPGPAFGGVGGVERVATTESRDGRWSVRLYGDGDRLAVDALAAAESRALPVVELRRLEGTLEDVFVHLTGRELR
jgi:ABC-2 type transport system ATP-binding protein